MDWRFLDVFKAIKSIAPYHGTYQPWLVGISVSIAILAAFVALSVIAGIGAYVLRSTGAPAGTPAVERTASLPGPAAPSVRQDRLPGTRR